MQRQVDKLRQVATALEATRRLERKEIVWRVISHWYETNVPKANRSDRSEFLKLNQQYGEGFYEDRLDGYINLVLKDIRQLPDEIRLVKRNDYTQLIKTVEGIIRRLDHTVEKINQHRIVLELILSAKDEKDLEDIEQSIQTLNPVPPFDITPYLI